MAPCCLLRNSKMGNLLNDSFGNIWKNEKFDHFSENYRGIILAHGNANTCVKIDFLFMVEPSNLPQPTIYLYCHGLIAQEFGLRCSYIRIISHLSFKRLAYQAHDVRQVFKIIKMDFNITISPNSNICNIVTKLSGVADFRKIHI